MCLPYIIHKIVLKNNQYEINENNKEKTCKELCRYLNIFANNNEMDYIIKDCLLKCYLSYKK